MKVKYINGMPWPDIDHHYQDYFNDNLIMFESCPIEFLSDINSLISKRNLEPLRNWDRFSNPKHPFHTVNHIPLGRFETLSGTELYCLTLPLVNFMTNQINLKFKNYVPAFGEINTLKPTVSIGRHTDAHIGIGYNFRMHLVLSTNDLVEFTIDNKIYYFPQGSCFIFDNTKEHEVHNNHTTLSRTHLIVDFCKNEDT